MYSYKREPHKISKENFCFWTYLLILLTGWKNLRITILRSLTAPIPKEDTIIFTSSKQFSYQMLSTEKI